MGCSGGCNLPGRARRLPTPAGRGGCSGDGDLAGRARRPPLAAGREGCSGEGDLAGRTRRLPTPAGQGGCDVTSQVEEGGHLPHRLLPRASEEFTPIIDKRLLIMSIFPIRCCLLSLTVLFRGWQPPCTSLSWEESRSLLLFVLGSVINGRLSSSGGGGVTGRCGC